MIRVGVADGKAYRAAVRDAKGFLNETSEELDLFEKEVGQEIQIASKPVDDLVDRWQENERIYANDAAGGNLDFIENFEEYHIPLSQPKIDRIRKTTTGAVLNNDPVFQIGISDTYHEVSSWTERLLDFLIREAGIEVILPMVVRSIANCGLGLVHDTMDSEVLHEYAHVHPYWFRVYPYDDPDLSKCRTCGRIFSMRKSDVEKMMKDKSWRTVEITPGGSKDNMFPKANPTGILGQQETYSNDRDKPIILFHGYTKRDLGSGEFWYQFIYIIKDKKCVFIEPIEIDSPPFTVFRFHTEDWGFWNEGSIGFNLQGLQQLYNDTWSTIIAGALMSAFKGKLITGGTLETEFRTIRIGEVIESPADLKLQEFGVTFDGGYLPLILDRVERVAEQVSHISRAGTGGQFHERTSATEASGIMEIQAEAESQYLTAIAPALIELAWRLVAYLKIYMSDFEKRYPDILQTGYMTLLPEDFIERVTDISVSAKPTSANSGVNIQKVRALVEIAVQYGIDFDPSELLRVIKSEMDLNINIEKIFPSLYESIEEDGANQGITNITQLLGGAGMDGNSQLPVPPNGGMEEGGLGGFPLG